MPRIRTLPRSAVLALAIPITLLLAWRVLVAGMDAMSGRGLASVPTDAAEAPLRSRLAGNPADTSALLLLGLELERQGRGDDAGEAMRMAVRLAPADPQFLLLVAGYFLRAGDDTQALATLRRAVDSSPGEVADRVWPVYAAALATGRHQKFFDTVARENPSWWPRFFNYVCTSASRAGAVQAVYAVRVAVGAATPAERQCVVERLQRDGQWADAYLVWLNGLPLDQRQRVGYVFNGGFELPLSNSGFDWRISTQDASVVASEPGDVHGDALGVTFMNQRYAGPPVYQYLVLTPGRYRLEGKARSDLAAWLGLQWSLYCLAGSQREARQLAHSVPFVGSTRWQDFGESFAVPPNCPAQVLRLELANPKQGANAPGTVAIRLKGKLWFDDLRVRIVD